MRFSLSSNLVYILKLLKFHLPRFHSMFESIRDDSRCGSDLFRRSSLGWIDIELGTSNPDKSILLCGLVYLELPESGILHPHKSGHLEGDIIEKRENGFLSGVSACQIWKRQPGLISVFYTGFRIDRRETCFRTNFQHSACSWRAKESSTS